MTWAQRWSVSMICLVWNFKVPSRRKVSIEREPLRKLERNTQSWNVAALFDFKCRLNINFCKKKSSSSSSRRPFSSHSLRPTDCWLAFHTKLVGGKNASDDPICVRKKKVFQTTPLSPASTAAEHGLSCCTVRIIPFISKASDVWGKREPWLVKHDQNKLASHLLMEHVD